jgi:hypothetical protein
MLGNLLIAYLYIITLYQQLDALSIPEPSIREPISSKTLTVKAVPLLFYDLLTTERGVALRSTRRELLSVLPRQIFFLELAQAVE